ncbi:hypothetical protein [Microvirga sp. VF16]|uniref:hypothetical protein n=1 Tax=Microvirga sp. VF16 TaxID=2807101 RepID=UPI00193C8E9D|nr:hypothetical protein [Microvirga sp. VF16]QRM35089.1 hypothetical protein JO965_39495 [Microvirga sp. VF16]
MNISPTEATGTSDYLLVLQSEFERFREIHADYMAGKFGDPTHPQVIWLYGWYASAARQIEQAIAAEQSRLTNLSTP